MSLLLHDVEFTISVLDHGFVRLRNLAGPTRRANALFDASDVDAPNAARLSFDQADQADRPAEADHRLAAYLMRNRHTSPFEMVTVWLEMKLPIFVARQFVRHRTASLNEVSARYVTLPGEWYVPAVVGAAPTEGAKQGQSPWLDPQTQRWFQNVLTQTCAASYQSYQAAVRQGVAPEHARLLLHVNHYTHWLWKQDLHNLLHFLSLRDHSHAQVEAQAYARAIDELLRAQLPETMKLYDRFRRLT